MPAAHEVKFDEKSGGDTLCADALAIVKAAATPPARSCALEANLDIVLSLVSTGLRRTCMSFLGLRFGKLLFKLVDPILQGRDARIEQPHVEKRHVLGGRIKRVPIAQPG